MVTMLLYPDPNAVVDLKRFVQNNPKRESNENAMRRYCVPNILHFTKPDGNLNEFTFNHFLAFYSAQRFLGMDDIILHADVEPTGFWWELAKKTGPAPLHLNLDLGDCFINQTRYGVNITRYQHKSDFLRFCLLEKYGGVYSDLDSYGLRPLNPSLMCSGNDVVLGVQKNYKRQVAVGFMLFRPEAKFTGWFRDKSEEAFGGRWDVHSVKLMSNLSGDDSLVLAVDVQNFYPLYEKVAMLGGKVAFPLPDSDYAFKESGVFHAWDASYAFHLFNSHKHLKLLKPRYQTPCWTFGVLYNAILKNVTGSSVYIPEGAVPNPKWVHESKWNIDIPSPIQLVHGYLTCEAVNDGTIPQEIVDECRDEMQLVCKHPQSFFFPPT